MLTAFDHVNLRTARLDEMVAWYGAVLDMHPGWRPDFPFPGAWLYLGEQPLVHLVGEDRERRNDDVKLEHFAFRATGFRDLVDRLDRAGIAPRLIEVPDAGIVQANIFDPDGNHIHVDFAAAEAQGDGSP